MNVPLSENKHDDTKVIKDESTEMQKNENYEDGMTTRLSFVVSLIDDYTGDVPLGTTDVSLTYDRIAHGKSLDLKKPIRKEGGKYWVFLDVNDVLEDNLFLEVSSSQYFDVKIPFNHTNDMANSKNHYSFPNLDNVTNRQQTKYPIFDVRLHPLPSYPFPTHTTLIRGVIQDTKKKPIENAKICCSEFDDDGNIFSVSSTKKGEFVYYLNMQNAAKFWSSSQFKEKLINSKSIIVTMRFAHQNFQEQDIKINVVEGQSHSVGLITLSSR